MGVSRPTTAAVPKSGRGFDHFLSDLRPSYGPGPSKPLPAHPHEEPSQEAPTWDPAVDSLLLIGKAGANADVSKDVLKETAEARRTLMWSKVHSARSATGQWNESLFMALPTSRGRSMSYELRPPEEQPDLNFPDIPLQLLHISPYTLPSHVADKSCEGWTVSRLLDELNDVFGSQRSLDIKSGSLDLEACLQEFIDDGCDLGLVYGYLRRVWWSDEDFSVFRERINACKARDLELRRKAIDSDRVINPRIPPRRVWDLYSNRVLPFYALDTKDGEIPSNVWAVSHPWRNPKRLHYLSTPINGYEWPVPLPYRTALARVRIELLNMGAEYVFLDVLCLRQMDPESQAHEIQRRKEWRIDVPTIGHVYRHSPSQTTVIYFNGLGVPFDIRERFFESPLHWFNRVWTLQEINVCWLLGGLWPNFYEFKRNELNGAKFTQLLSHALNIIDKKPDILTLLEAVKARSGCAHEVDRVAALGYLLQCPRLPLYDQHMPTEEAWSLLIEDMSGDHRLDLLLCYTDPGTGDAWRPSWTQAMTCDPARMMRLSKDPGTLLPQYSLRYISRYEPGLGYRHPSDVYFHRALVVRGCRIVETPFTGTRDEGDTSCTKFVLSLPKTHRWGSIAGTMELSVTRNSLVCGPNHTITAVRMMHSDTWVVGESAGWRRIGTEMAAVVRKIAVTRTTVKDFDISLTCPDISTYESCVVYV